MSLQKISKWRTELMGLAALWIIYFHLGPPLFASRRPLFAQFGWLVQRIGYGGVDIFMFLSGLGVYYALCRKRQNTLQFYVHRFLRVYPAYLVCYLFVTWPVQSEFAKMLPSFVFWPNFAHNLYAAWWFVPAILLFYLLSPLYCRLFEKAGSKTLFTLCAIVATQALIPLCLLAHRTDFYGLVQRMPCYLFGIYCGWRLQNPACLCARRRNALVWGAAVGGFALSYLFNKVAWLEDFNCYPVELMAPALCCLAAWAIDAARTRLPQRNWFAPLTFIGRCSLEYYLLQEIIVSPALDRVGYFVLLPEMTQRWLVFGLKVLVSAGMAMLLHTMIDCCTKHLLQRADRVLAPKAAQPVSTEKGA